jgi:D-serine deaminase-like pyridoxal phosphate-dependent protein
MTSLLDIETPAAIVDVARMHRNIARMQDRMNALGVNFRPHVKTTKCVDVVDRQRAAGANGLTVSTLREAEAFFAAGYDDILYAVCIAPHKLERAPITRSRVPSHHCGRLDRGRSRRRRGGDGTRSL